ncbi:hypothetical protein PRK78_002828 [Emydomyces testavorans]|uniref:Zn(2)-C6 fungal-type domain-containing protein n=1 Tax=Emydomyces testavorans TaxID=2070801 RepID=A0AAF0DF09_9EURO|nr:hypothetical protein PRK78_002828 [Emydomyces testavorans]
MSGSPSPRDRLNSCQEGKRKRLDVLAPATSQQAVQQPVTYGSYPPKAQGTNSSVNEPQQSSINRSGVSAISVSTTNEPHLLPALGPATPIPPRTTPLPPRSTRRAKAHVASACVNCKRKHLGCDSARPCRRCVVAGKESSCVDVTHKRRGRPPLKAEEGPLRSYEPAFGQSSTLRLSHQPHLQPSGSHHQRESASREIRPNTDSRFAEAPRERQRLILSPLIPMKPQPWGPSMLPSPSATLPPPSPLGSAPLQRPLSSGSAPLSTDRHGSVLSPVVPVPGPPHSLSDISHLPPLSRDQLPPRSPRQYKQPTSAAPYSSIPGPMKRPSNLAIRLPPIPPPLTKLKLTIPTDAPQTVSNTSSPWPAGADLVRSQKPFDSTPHTLSPLAPEQSGLIERRWSHEQPLVSPSYSLPPIREPAEPLQRQRCFSASAMMTAGHRDILNSPTVSEGTLEGMEDRPVKRRKMELGEMVNT